MLNNAPNRIYNQHDAAEELFDIAEPSCCICFEVFTPRTVVISPYCGHVYCRACYNTIKNRRNRCVYAIKVLQQIIIDCIFDSTISIKSFVVIVWHKFAGTPYSNQVAVAVYFVSNVLNE